MGETAILCTDCADDEHQCCIGRPECGCPCNDLAEQDGAFLDSLREPVGTPCNCGGGADEHERAIVYRTPTRWGLRVDRHWQSATGIWWIAFGERRYFPTEEKARAAADRRTNGSGSQQ